MENVTTYYQINRSLAEEEPCDVLQYGYKVAKISIKGQTVDFEKIEEET